MHFLIHDGLLHVHNCVHSNPAPTAIIQPLPTHHVTNNNDEALTEVVFSKTKHSQIDKETQLLNDVIVMSVGYKPNTTIQDQKNPITHF